MHIAQGNIMHVAIFGNIFALLKTKLTTVHDRISFKLVVALMGLHLRHANYN